MTVDHLLDVRRGLHERLLRRVDASALEDVSRADRRVRVREEALAILREDGHVLPQAVLSRVVNEVSDSVVGLGPIEFLLRDPDVTEVMVNGPDDVYVERKGPLDFRAVDHHDDGALRAFGYVRISKMDDGTTSPQRQRQAIERWCRDRGVELVEVFEDLDLSAYSRRVRRPGLERILARLGEVDAIVCWRLDRLARSVSGFSRMLERFDAADVKVATTDGQVDMTTAAGRAMVQMTAVFAELEAGTTSERARQMHAFKRERGEWVGRVPFGFRLNGKTLEVDSESFSVLEDAARRYVAGESLRRISVDIGIRHSNLAKSLRTDRVIDALPPRLAARLTEAMAERGRTGMRARRSLLGGIARCDVCSGAMTVVGVSAGWAAYSCRERGHVTISKPWLDQYVTTQVLDAIDTGKLLRRLARRKRPARSLASSEIEARLELLEVDHYERGIVERDSYLRRREGLIRRLQEAKAAEADDGIDLPAELARNLSERWPELSVHGQRRIISAVLDRIDVRKANGHGRVNPSRVSLAWRA